MIKSHVVKRSVVIAGHKTSVSLEDAFWEVLKDAASSMHRPLSDVVAEIDRTKAEGANLSSAVRLYVLDHVRSQAARRHP